MKVTGFHDDLTDLILACLTASDDLFRSIIDHIVYNPEFREDKRNSIRGKEKTVSVAKATVAFLKAVSYLCLYIFGKEAFKWYFANVIPIISIL